MGKIHKETIINLLKANIRKWTALQFNEKINQIFRVVYGENYKTIKQKYDKGSDGIIETHMEHISIACYGSENPTSKKIINKIGKDYPKYKENYKPLGYKFRFITNYEILGEVITYLKNLDQDSDIWGINEIIEFIFSQPLIIRKRILSEILNVSEELIELEIFTEIIEDIADRVLKSYTPPEFSGDVTQLEEKVKKNFTNPLYAQGIMNLFTDIYFEYQYFIEKTLESLDSDTVKTVYSEILGEYLRLAKQHNSFEEIFEQLIDIFSRKYATDEERRKYVKMLILYIFEQCVIGVK